MAAAQYGHLEILHMLLGFAGIRDTLRDYCDHDRYQLSAAMATKLLEWALPTEEKLQAQAETEAADVTSEQERLQKQIEVLQERLVVAEQMSQKISRWLADSLEHIAKTAGERTTERDELAAHHGKAHAAAAKRQKTDDAAARAKAADSTQVRNQRVAAAEKPPPQKKQKKQQKAARTDYVPVRINPANNLKIMTLSTVYSAMKEREGQALPATDKPAICAWIAEHCLYKDGRKFSVLRGYEDPVARLQEHLGSSIAEAWRVIPTAQAQPGGSVFGKKKRTFTGPAKDWLKKWRKANKSHFPETGCKWLGVDRQGKTIAGEVSQQEVIARQAGRPAHLCR
jgi:hypothetical protein